MAHTAQPLEKQLKRLADLAQAHPEHRHVFGCLIPEHLRNQRAVDALLALPNKCDGLNDAYVNCKVELHEWVQRIRERGGLLLLGAVQ